MDKELGSMRREIDEIDRKILRLLEKRVEVARRIGKHKKDLGLGIDDAKREEEVIENAVKDTQLEKGFVKKVYSSFIEYCKHEEK